MFLEMEEDYPSGAPGDLAVRYFYHLEAGWTLEPVSTREEADERYKEVLARSDVHEVIIDHRPKKGMRSAAAWIAKCEGGDQWVRIVQTEGAGQYWAQWD